MALEFSKHISTFIIVFFQELHRIYHPSPPRFLFFSSLAKLEQCLSIEGVCRHMDGMDVC